MSFLDFWYDEYLKNILYLKPISIACSSLFYDGLAELKIYANDFSKNDFNGSYYNIFSLYRIKQYLKNKKFSKFKKEFMDIDINLKKPKHLGMGSYTVNLKNNKKIIKSGPISLPHGYFFASKWIKIFYLINYLFLKFSLYLLYNPSGLSFNSK